DDATYRQWTTAFHEGSYAVTDWSAGSKALFLTPQGDGLVSRIAAHRPNEFLSIEHVGLAKNHVEDTTSEAITGWAGAFESYWIEEMSGTSKLTVEMDVTDKFKMYFEET